MLADLRSGANGADIYYGFTEFQGSLYFSANDGVNGNELWKVNPTTGLTMVKDIRPGSDGSNINHIIVVGNSMYFVADDGTNGYEMWRSDGTNIGTYMVANLNPGTGDSYPNFGLDVKPSCPMGICLGEIQVFCGTDSHDFTRSSLRTEAGGRGSMELWLFL